MKQQNQVSYINHSGHSKEVHADRVSLAWVMAKVHRMFGFGFGVGLLRPASGTWGTLVAWLLWWPLRAIIAEDMAMAVFLLLAFLFGIYCCQKTGRELGAPDHGGMIWDEWVAFWLILFVINPLDNQAVWSTVAFVLFRIFDIVKPFPIAFFDNFFKNGFGVMIDDMLAAAYALFSLAIILRLYHMLAL